STGAAARAAPWTAPRSGSAARSDGRRGEASGRRAVKNKMQVAAFVVLIGFGYAIYEFYDFSTTEVPKMENERLTKEKELGDRQNELKKLKDFANNIEVIKQELRELNLQLELALEHMPRTFNLSGLLRKLTMLAQNSGVELSSFRPKAQEVK